MTGKKSPHVKTAAQIREESKLFEPSVEHYENPQQVRRDAIEQRRLRQEVVGMSQQAVTERLALIHEFAKHLDYSLTEAREEFPGASEEDLVRLWAERRWLMAQAMVDYRPDLSVNLRVSA